VNLVEVAIAKAKSAVKTEEVNTLVTSDELSGHRFSSSTIQSRNREIDSLVNASTTYLQKYFCDVVN